MNGRTLLLVIGAALLGVAVFMPVDWYSSLPFRPDLATPPIKGVTLLRLVLGAQAFALLLVALLGWRYVRRPGSTDAVPGSDEHDLDRRTALWVLAAITLLALFLRVYRVSSDLWLDEISALVGFGQGSVLEILTVFSRSGNHVLNTLLVKLCVALFGEQEWAVRLPAVLFGVATIPALYWMARLALSRYASLASALLLAVSYHHIFFSQNARGYSAHMFFSVVSSVLFVRALDDDRPRTWVLYSVCALFNVASLLLSAVVVAGHFLTGMCVAFDAQRRGGDGGAFVRRLFAVFTAIGLLALTLYAVVIPQAVAGLSAPYRTLTSGFAPLSGEFLADVVRGVVAGFGPLLLAGAIPFVGIGAVGFWLLLRSRWTLAVAVVSPLVLTFTIFVARGMTLRPRFFLFAVPIAMLCFVHGLFSLTDLVATRFSPTAAARISARLKAGALAVLAVASLISLVGYYRVPKQSYRAAIAFLEQTRRPGDVVVVYGNAELGFRFYGGRAGLADDPDYVYLRDPALVDSVLFTRPHRDAFLVFTLARDLRLSAPEFAASLQRDWTRLRVFPATVGDGNITVLRRTE